MKKLSGKIWKKVIYQKHKKDDWNDRSKSMNDIVYFDLRQDIQMQRIEWHDKKESEDV